jgi:rRNA-processing protein FCF1
MKKIILDTNFLLIPGQFKVDIIFEIGNLMDAKYDLYVIDQTIDELKKIVEEAPAKYKAAARIGLMLVKNHKIAKIKAKKGHVDDLIVEEAAKNPKDTVVATQDQGLKAKLRKKGIKTIVLRQRRYLAVV